jgi:hypothetical protein
MAFGIVQQGFAAASLHKADDCAMILDWLVNSYWFPNFVTTHNPKAIFNTDLSGGLPALIIRMLIDSQPGWIELLPAWPGSMPTGKIEGVALRGGIIAKELSWNGKDISMKLVSSSAQKVLIRTQSAIDIIKGDKMVKISGEDGKYYLLLPEKQVVSVDLVLK